MIGGIIGGVIGILGGLVGTYCSIRNTRNRAERRFVIRMALLCLIGVTVFLTVCFLLPAGTRWVAWTVYPMLLIPWIIHMNRRQAVLREGGGDDGEEPSIWSKLPSARSVIKWFAIVAVGLIVAFVVAVGAMGYSFKKSLEHTTNPKAYPDIVAVRSEWPGYGFLPKGIDPRAERVAFFHVPGFGQGGDFVCLRLTLPADLVKQNLADLESSGRQEVEAKVVSSYPAYPPYDMAKLPKWFLDKIGELPRDFRVFLFHTDLEDIEKNPNHNFMAFTAVSPTTNEVIYFAESW